MRWREGVDFDIHSLRYTGDRVEANSDRRLSLLEKLGYVEKVLLQRHYDVVTVAEILYRLFVDRRSLPPVLYEYRCLKDVPSCMLFDDA